VRDLILSSVIRFLIRTRFRLLCDPHRSHGMIGNCRSAAYSLMSFSEQ
jgi:hypothetical protein